MLALLLVALGLLLALAWIVRQLEPRMAFFPFAGETVTPERFGIAYTPHTIATADDERLHAWHLPRSEARAQVVYFHGNGGNHSVWADVYAGLWREGFDVFAVDYRGYGRSTGTPTEQGLYRDVEATVGFVNTHVRRAELPLIYWGRSLGATMAAYAARHQAPDGIILEAGFPDARAVLQSNPVMLVLSFFATYRFATSEWMASVAAPALVIHGDRDSVIPYRLGRRLYEGLSGPKTFVTIPGGDHNDPEPADPELYWREVHGFVELCCRVAELRTKNEEKRTLN